MKLFLRMTRIIKLWEKAKTPKEKSETAKIILKITTEKPEKSQIESDKKLTKDFSPEKFTKSRMQKRAAEGIGLRKRVLHFLRKTRAFLVTSYRNPSKVTEILGEAEKVLLLPFKKKPKNDSDQVYIPRSIFFFAQPVSLPRPTSYPSTTQFETVPTLGPRKQYFKPKFKEERLGTWVSSYARRQIMKKF